MLERMNLWLRRASPAQPAASAATVEPAGQAPTAVDALHAVVIEVRSEREFQAAAIDQAINLPLPRLEQRIRELVTDTSTPLFLYCASGARSGVGCRLLRQLGYSNVTNAGGLLAAAAQLQREVRR